MKEFTLKCPVCSEDVEWYGICEKCNYQNSGPKEKEEDPLGPNKMTLNEAREAYKNGEKIL